MEKSFKKYYVSSDGKLMRRNPFCLRCGRGVFMADAGDFWSCGKCGFRVRKDYWKTRLSKKAK